MAAVFIAQSTLDEWSDQGRIRLDGTILTLLHENRTVPLKPAVRFTKLVGAPTDAHSLLGKVKSHEQLAALSAEHFMQSVIVGDTAYEVVEGFLGDLRAPPRGPGPKAVEPSAPVQAPPAQQPDARAP